VNPKDDQASNFVLEEDQVGTTGVVITGCGWPLWSNGLAGRQRGTNASPARTRKEFVATGRGARVPQKRVQALDFVNGVTLLPHNGGALDVDRGTEVGRGERNPINLAGRIKHKNDNSPRCPPLGGLPF